MSRRLTPEQRASAASRLSQVAREFIDIHLARGATPRTIMETYNAVTRLNPQDAERMLPRGTGFLRTQEGRTWARIIGQRPLTLVETRREYDRLRKYHHGEGTLNVNRRRNITEFQLNDLRRVEQLRALAGAGYVPREQRGVSRKLHDLGLARRFGATRDELQKIADELGVDVPGYLDF